MLARYVQKGDAIDYRPTEAVAAGDVVIIADLIGIARLDIEANTLGSLAVVGVFDVGMRPASPMERGIKGKFFRRGNGPKMNAVGLYDRPTAFPSS